MGDISLRGKGIIKMAKGGSTTPAWQRKEGKEHQKLK
jgi:hypothetical protein